MSLLTARLPKEKIPHTYRWIAPFYDFLAVAVTGRARQLAFEWAAVEDGERVLEVAVGTGLSFEHLLRQNPNGWTEGLDLSPAMLQRAERRARQSGTRNFRLSIGDAYRLDFPDASFDLVLNSYMFDLLPEPDFVPVLQEFARVLRPGGRIVQLNMTHGEHLHNQLWQGLYRLHPALLGGCRNIAMRSRFEVAGFVQVRRAYVSQWTYPSEVVLGIKPLHTKAGLP